MEDMEFYRDNFEFQLNYYLKHRKRSASEMNDLPLELRFCVSYMSQVDEIVQRIINRIDNS